MPISLVNRSDIVLSLYTEGGRRFNVVIGLRADSPYDRVPSTV